MDEAKNPILGSADMQQYFSTLPTFIKESIEQSGVKFETVQELRAFVSNLTKSN